MPRILLRAGKSPFEQVSPATVFWDDLIARNNGNLLFAHSAYKMLSAPGVEINVTRYRNPPAEEADEINEKYDAIVLPLANAFRPDFENQLVSLTALIRKLKIPVVVVGVGTQAELGSDPNQKRRLDDTAKAFLSAVLDRSASVGVRGEFTKLYLNSLGFSAVEVIGCPSMFLYGDRLTVAKRVASLDASSPIAVNLTNGMPKNIGPLYQQVYAQRPNATYMPQSRADLAMLLWGQPADRGKEGDLLPRSPDHPMIASGRVRFFTDVTPWIDFLKARDFSFGTRIHGNVFAILAGTPGYVIAHDSRTLELARYFEIPHCQVSDITERTSVEALYDEADYGPLVKNHATRFATYHAFLEKNGIDSIFGHPGEAEAFEARLAAVDLPEGVSPLATVNHGEALRRTTELALLSTKRVANLESRLAERKATQPASAGPGTRPPRGTAAAAPKKRRWWQWK